MNSVLSEIEIDGRLTAAAIDSGAALALCGLLLQVVSQMPEARALIRAALDQADPPADASAPVDRAAELIALDRLRQVCEPSERRAA